MAMATAETICGHLLIAGFEVLFLAGAAWVWRELARMRVNGPCQIGLGLLVVLRLSEATAFASTGSMRGLDWTWLTETLFSFAFLYMLYHVGVLVATTRAGLGQGQRPRGRTAVTGRKACPTNGDGRRHRPARWPASP